MTLRRYTVTVMSKIWNWKRFHTFWCLSHYSHIPFGTCTHTHTHTQNRATYTQFFRVQTISSVIATFCLFAIIVLRFYKNLSQRLVADSSVREQYVSMTVTVSVIFNLPSGTFFNRNCCVCRYPLRCFNRLWAVSVNFPSSPSISVLPYLCVPYLLIRYVKYPFQYTEIKQNFGGL